MGEPSGTLRDRTAVNRPNLQRSFGRVIICLRLRMRKLITLVLLAFLVAAPVAMAADGCSGIGMVCAAPCSAPCVSVSPSMGGPVLTPVAALVPFEPPTIPTAALQVLDAPPKSLLLA